MEQVAVLDRPQAIPASHTHDVRGELAAPTATPSRKDTARRALLLWTGIDGSCRAPELAATGLFAPDFRCYGPTRTRMGLAADTEPLAGLDRGFSERSLSISRMVESGNRVISYVRFTGRHTGEYQGYRPSGRLMQADGYVVHLFNDEGLIAQEWSVFRWS